MRAFLLFSVLALISTRMESQAAGGADTSRPALPNTMQLPLDSTKTVAPPGVSRSDALYYRDIVGVIFDDTTSGLTVRRLLGRHHGTIIGGVPGDGEYIVRIPDPGRTFDALESVVARFNAEVGVALVRKVYYRWKPILNGSTGDSIGPFGWPVLITTFPSLDTSEVVELPGGHRLYRTSITLRFTPGVSDSAKVKFFRRHWMQVIGVTRAMNFFVRIPDPGRPVDRLYQVLEGLRREPEVEIAALLHRDPLSQTH